MRIQHLAESGSRPFGHLYTRRIPPQTLFVNQHMTFWTADHHEFETSNRQPSCRPLRRGQKGCATAHMPSK